MFESNERGTSLALKGPSGVIQVEFQAYEDSSVILLNDPKGNLRTIFAAGEQGTGWTMLAAKGAGLEIGCNKDGSSLSMGDHIGYPRVMIRSGRRTGILMDNMDGDEVVIGDYFPEDDCLPEYQAKREAGFLGLHTYSGSKRTWSSTDQD